MLDLTQKDILFLSLFGSLLFIAIVLIIILFLKLNKYIKKQNKLMRIINNQSIEDILLDNLALTKRIESGYSIVKEEIDKIKEKLSHSLQNEGFVKYSAMAEVGGELSYSAAFLDDNDTGFVISGLYYRDGMNTFVKQIINGQSNTTLTPEEKKAINIAIENKNKKMKNIF